MSSRLFLWVALSGLFWVNTLGQAGAYRVVSGGQPVAVPIVDTLALRLKSAPGYAKLAGYEQDLLYALNFARLYPLRFRQEVLYPYLKSHPEQVGQYSNSLVATLNKQPPLGYLLPDDRLYRLAKSHLDDQINATLFSHNSSDGRSTDDRMSAAGIKCWGESMNMSMPCQPVEVVISQLLDINVPGLGHRKALLSPEHRWIGLAVGSRKDGLQLTVIDLGCFD